MKKTNVFWFRRDLRDHDNHGFFEALVAGLPVMPIFIFDQKILKALPKDDHRVSFIYNALKDLNEKFLAYKSSLQVYIGEPLEVYKKIVTEFDVDTVFTNHDYEPYAYKRDETVEKFLTGKKIKFKTFKDQVIFEKNEVVKSDGKYYTIFTPYSNKWRENFKALDFKHYPSEKNLKNLLGFKSKMPTLKEVGFEPSKILAPGKTVKKEILTKYAQQRNFPAQKSTSQLGVHLRFGTVSIRDAVQKANELKAATWLTELIWREFFMQILWHNPYVIDSSFKEKYEKIKWRNNEKEFKAWCEGKTGYPIVDAGMRELNATGFMHNRVRMVTGSFLVKHLLIDWRWGEKYFAQKLFDFDLSANNGNWQWVSGSGCDSAPYFRIFNPDTQTEKFDKDHTYIKKWVPEYKTKDYPDRIVVHEFARERCLKAYSVINET